MMRWKLAGASLAVVAAGLAGPAHASLIDATFSGSGWDQTRMDVVHQAIDDWSAVVLEDETFEVFFELDEELDAAGTWTPTFFPTDNYRRPWENIANHEIALNTSLNLHWETSDFSENASFSGLDAYSVLLHEIGHALGFNTLYVDPANGGSVSPWEELIVDDVFDPGGLDVPMVEGDSAHIDVSSDLMYTGIASNQRRLIEEHHYEMLGMAYGYEVIPEPASAVLLLGGFGAVAMRRRRAAA